MIAIDRKNIFFIDLYILGNFLFKNNKLKQFILKLFQLMIIKILDDIQALFTPFKKMNHSQIRKE
jgi:hypothetical protein